MKKILRRIVNDLWAYILWIVVVIVAWTLIFGYLTHIDVDEKVCVFVGSQSAGFEKYEELNEKRPEYLKKVEVNAYSINDGMFSTVLSIFGYEAGDILILPESRLSEESCPQSFAEISPSYCQQFANKGFYTADGKVYGLLVHEKGNTESLISCIDYGKSENDDKENLVVTFVNGEVQNYKLNNMRKIDEKYLDGAEHEVVFGIRGENIVLDDKGLTSTLTIKEILGNTTQMFVKILPDTPDCIVCLSERNEIKAGDKVKIKFDERKIHLFDKETELAIMSREFGN